MIGYEVLIDRLNGTPLSVYRTKKTTAMAHLNWHALAENSFKNRSIVLVGLIVSLKNDRNGRGFKNFVRTLRATVLLEPPFRESWICHCNTVAIGSVAKGCWAKKESSLKTRDSRKNS